MSALNNSPLLGASGSQGYFLQRSVRIRGSASAYFNRTPAVASNRQTWTWSGWIKRGALGASNTFFCNGSPTGTNITQLLYSGEALSFQVYDTNTIAQLVTTAVYRDPSAWYHVVAVMNTTDATSSNRMKLYVNGVQVTAFGTAIYPTLNLNAFVNTVSDHSIGNILFGGSRTNQSDGYVEEINFIDGQALTPASFGAYNSTTGVWQPKKYAGTYGTNGFYLQFTNNTLSTLLSTSGNISAPFGGVAINALVADGVYCTSNTSTGSAFTFILNDFGSATQVTRYTIVNLSFTGGVSTFSVQGSPDNSTWTTFATLAVTASNQSFSGSLNGNFRYWRLAPTAFGTNGQAAVDQCVFYQDGLGLDFSGNGNNWTPNNISVTAGVTYDSMTDVPTLTSPTQANYAVLNPLNNSGGVTISDGNLKALWASASDRSVLSTFPVPSTGKFYAEFVNGTLTSASVAVAFGLATEGSSRTGMAAANMWVYYASNQSYIVRSGTFSSQIGSNQTIAAGGIVQVAIDRANNQAWLGYNNVWINATNGTTGDPSAGTNPTVSSLPADLFIIVGLYADNGNANFGQRPFAYTPPTGFVALNTYNLPTPTIPNGATQFAATTYTGTGSAMTVTNTVNSVFLQPDFLWIKQRNSAANHVLADSIRGVNKYIFSNLTNAEATATAGTGITAFNSNGFSLGTETSTVGSVNAAGGTGTYIAWQWKESASSGLDIVLQTLGTTGINTITHNLGVVPKMVIAKRTNGVEQWLVYQSSATTQSQYLGLNTTAAVATSANLWGSSAFTSSQIYFNGTSGNAYVFYIFSEIAGYSKFGSYTGNGSTDGTFVYLGFRPRFVMIKQSSTSGEDWYISDTSRDTYNQSNTALFADLSNAEASNSARGLDILSNGIKLRGTSSANNASGATYIYMAFAESPFNYSLAR